MDKVSFRKTSLVDYPSKIASCIFFAFCNLRCPWCHNGALISGNDDALISLDDAIALIEKRKNVLGGVVLSGGEPTLFSELEALIVKIKSLGLAIKLDTNGTRPDIIKQLLSKDETRPDFIALDLKLAPPRYAELCATKNDAINVANNIIQSAKIIRESGIEFEMRSLVLPKNYFTKTDVDELSPLAGNGRWVFRAFRPGSCLDSAWDSFPAPSEKIVNEFSQYSLKLTR